MTAEQEFQDVLEADDSLESVLDWIRNNLEPHDVFGEDTLMEWASRETPEDIFPEWELEEWAVNNDFNRE